MREYLIFGKGLNSLQRMPWHLLIAWAVYGPSMKCNRAIYPQSVPICLCASLLLTHSHWSSSCRLHCLLKLAGKRGKWLYLDVNVMALHLSQAPDIETAISHHS